MTTTQPLPTTASVAEAAENVAPHVRRTPVLRAQVDGRPLVLKLEHLQRGGSFKLRGAVNALAARPLPTHVVTASGGNHGIAVATAAAALGLPATVYVPAAAPEGKTRRIEAAGARLVRHGATYGEAAVAALAASAGAGRAVRAGVRRPGRRRRSGHVHRRGGGRRARGRRGRGRRRRGRAVGGRRARLGRTDRGGRRAGGLLLRAPGARGGTSRRLRRSSPSRPRRWARPGWARCRSPSCRRRTWCRCS